MNIKKFFTCGRIIYSRYCKPGRLMRSFTHDGNKYARIQIDNLCKVPGHVPITDVMYKDIYKVRRLPSPFKRWLYKHVGLKPMAKTVYQSTTLIKLTTKQHATKNKHNNRGTKGR